MHGGAGAAAGCRDIGVYDTVDSLKLFYDLLDAPGVDPTDSNLSDADGDPVPRRLHGRGWETGMALVRVLSPFRFHSDTLSTQIYLVIKKDRCLRGFIRYGDVTPGAFVICK